MNNYIKVFNNLEETTFLKKRFTKINTRNRKSVDAFFRKMYWHCCKKVIEILNCSISIKKLKSFSKLYHKEMSHQDYFTGEFYQVYRKWIVILHNCVTK